jgi:adenosine kinase
MSFPGLFSQYILPDKISLLNVCFPVSRMEEKRGGSGGNIAYTLALLGEKGLLLSSVGRDFGPYMDFLRGLGLPLEGIHTLPDELTAGAYITTDQQANQITVFHSAAMNTPCGYAFSHLDPKTDLAIISPVGALDMEAHARFYHERGVRYIFDPGQQIAALSPQALLAGISGAAVLTSNAYELDLILSILNLKIQDLLALTPAVITTLAEQGSIVRTRDGGETLIRAVPLKQAQDPTGAGDAYRAGLLKGLRLGLSLEDAARLGSACASFCVEKQGAQEHLFSPRELNQRLQKNYALKPLAFTPLLPVN